MTSQPFTYDGSELPLRSGDGNDTIWANNGNNPLFGDAGDDRLASGAIVEVYGKVKKVSAADGIIIMADSYKIRIIDVVAIFASIF